MSTLHSEDHNYLLVLVVTLELDGEDTEELDMVLDGQEEAMEAMEELDMELDGEVMEQVMEQVGEVLEVFTAEDGEDMVDTALDGLEDLGGDNL